MNFDNHLDDKYTPVIPNADVPIDWGLTTPEMHAPEEFQLPQVTAHQKERADLLITALLAKGVACLSGKGGVGKTFTTRYILDVLMEETGKRPVIVATTNKAASVLYEEINLPVVTSHSYLKFREYQGEFIATDDTEMLEADFIVVDEFSMMQESILKQFFKMYKKGTKLLFVGDNTQLIFSQYILDSLKKVPTEYLMIPMRALPDSGIFKFCSDQSDAIMEQRGMLDITKYASDDLVLHYTNASFYAEFDKLPEQFDKVVISYRNKTAFQHDATLEKRGKGELFMDGDKVRSRDTMKLNAYAAEALGRNEGDTIIRTAEIFDIVNVEYYEKEMYYKATHSKNGFTFYIPEFPTKYDKDLANILAMAKSGQRAWRDYYEMKAAFCRLYHSRFITAHSAQGSGFDTVFVDLKDIKYAREADVRARLLYTAVGRAKRMVHVLV